MSISSFLPFQFQHNSMRERIEIHRPYSSYGPNFFLFISHGSHHYEARTLLVVAVSAKWTRGHVLDTSRGVSLQLNYFLEGPCGVHSMDMRVPHTHSRSLPHSFSLLFICVHVCVCTCIYLMYISPSLLVYIVHIYVYGLVYIPIHTHIHPHPYTYICTIHTHSRITSSWVFIVFDTFKWWQTIFYCEGNKFVKWLGPLVFKG